VIPYSLGFLLKFFRLTDSVWLPLSLITIGWYVMVTGQSIVLYSRLHLVLHNPTTLRRVLYMIIVDAVVLHIPTTILTYGSNLGNANTSVFVRGYGIMEKIQMTGFCIQEFIISGLYIWETAKMLRASPEKGNRKIMYQLLSISVAMVAMDLCLLSVEYANLYVIETTVKGMTYSLKLKLEFAVLGKLVHLVNSHSGNAGFNIGSDGFPDFVDASRITSTVTHAHRSATGSPKPPWVHADNLSLVMLEHLEGRSNDSTGERSGEHVSFSSEARGVRPAPKGGLTLMGSKAVPHPRGASHSDYLEWPS
jgi:hypothetical protein